MPSGVPDFNQYVEYVTEIGAFPVALEQHDLANPATLQILQSGYQDALALGHASVILGANELSAIKTVVAAAFPAGVADHEVTSNPVAIVGRLLWCQQQPVWKVGGVYRVGDVVVYAVNSTFYQCLQAHTASDPSWTPTFAHSLWALYYPTDVIAEWVQPISVDAYPLGAKVTWHGFTWQSNVSANVWEPGVSQWTNLTPPVNPNWAAGVAYKIGDVVLYVPNGLTYRCLQAHTSIATWNPPAVPALWVKV